MNSNEIATITMDAVLEVLGDDATYYPIVGPARSVRVFLRKREQVIDGMGVTRLNTDGQIIEIERASLSVEPQPGDKVKVMDVVYLVKSAKLRLPAQTVWELSCEPAA